MTDKLNRFTAYTNCPEGEYEAKFINSEIKSYPRGEREILTFLILREDGSPFINNQGSAYYSVIVCNKSKGSSPKSKINTIKLCMLDEKEFDPVKVFVGLPDIETFYDRNFKVRVTSKGENYNFITHIQRPRDLTWEHIELNYEGKLKKIDLVSLIKKKLNKLSWSERNSIEEIIEVYLKDKNMPFNDENGKFTGEFNQNKFEKLDKHKQYYSKNIYENIIKFLETEDINSLFNRGS